MLKVFEIKLYGCSPEEFEEKIDKKRKEFYLKCRAQNRSSFESMSLYSRFYAGKNTYENYSIGYLEVLYDGFLRYEAKIMFSKKYSSKKEKQMMLDKLELDRTLSEEQKDERRAAILNSYLLVPYKPRLFTEKKRYMSNQHIEGMYTDTSGLTNFEIAQAIKNDISDIQEFDYLQGVYFDLSHFNEIIEFIDFKSLFNKYSFGGKR